MARLQVDNGRKRYFYGPTKEHVRRRLREAQRAMEDERPVPDARLTVGQFLEQWLESLPLTDVKPSTVDFYRQYVRRHLGGAIGAVPLARLAPQDLRHLYAAKLASGLSRTTVHHVHAVLHRALTVAAREGIVQRNVADLIDAPGIVRAELHVLSGDQPDRFVANLEGEPLEALFVLAVTSGMRQGELLALRWENVDLERAELEVVGSLSRHHGDYPAVVAPKTGKTRRLSLAPIAVSSLRAHRRRQIELRLAFGDSWLDRDLVFPDCALRPGDYLRPAALNRNLNRVLAKAGLPHVRFHDLRHTAATRLLSRGVHPKIASEMLGHSSIHVTMDRYSHVTSTMQREAVAAAWADHQP